MKGFRPDAIIMDAPRMYHASKFLVFLCVEGLLIATGVLAYSEPLQCSRPQVLQTMSWPCSGPEAAGAVDQRADMHHYPA
jgi:hypothetical protein